MKKSFLSLVAVSLVLFFSASVVFATSFSDLITWAQKQKYWSIMSTDCMPLLAAKNYKNYRTCALNALETAAKYQENAAWCKDSDNGANFLQKGIVTTNLKPNGVTDYIHTFPNGSTYLMEGMCSNTNKYYYMQKNCSDLGSKYHSDVAAGACIYVNHTPKLMTVTEKTEINEGEYYEIFLYGTDEDWDNLAFSGENLPEGSIIDENAPVPPPVPVGTKHAVFSWTPTYQQSGEYEIKFIVSDGGLEDEEVVTITVIATWSSDPSENLPLVIETDNQAHPQGVSDGEGGMIFAWDDRRNGDYDIYAQRINAEGMSLWGQNGVAIAVAGNNQMFPEIISDSEGGVIIVWEDERYSQNPNTGENNLFAQRVDSNGNITWEENGVEVSVAEGNHVNISNVGSSGSPSIISDGENGVIVTWWDANNGDKISAQRISSQGEALWGEDGKQICSECIGYWPTLTTDGEGGAIITWSTDRIFVQRVNSDGDPMWGDSLIPLAPPYSKQSNVSISNDGSGNAMVAWRYAGGDTPGMYMQKINIDGAIQWEEKGVLISKADGGGPMAIRDDEDIIVTWTHPVTNENYDIYAQKIDSFGKILWGEYGVVVGNSETLGYQNTPFVVPDGFGGVIIAWVDQRNSPFTEGDLYAQRLDDNGNRLWGNEDVAVCTAPGFQIFPTMVSDYEGGAIIIWADGRTSGAPNYWDIYGQRILWDGTLG